jgi:uncharacterized protein YjdB
MARPETLVTVGILLLCACQKQGGGSPLAPEPPPVPQPIITSMGPDQAALVVGGTLQFQAVARNSVVTGWTWSVTDPALAIVSEAGVVTGRAPGTVGIRACGTNAPATCASVNVDIVPVPAGGVPVVTVVPPTGTIMTGQNVEFAATAANFDPAGFSWTSLDDITATITADGKLTGRRAGTVVVAACSASVPHFCGSAVVVVH